MHESSIEELVTAAEREWRRLHVAPTDVARLSHDLRDDLASAAAEGADPADLIGADPRGFARRLADEAGVGRIPYEFDRLLLTALVGSLPGLAVGYAFYAGYLPIPLPPPPDQPDTGAVVAAYASLSALVLLSSLLTVWFRLRTLPAMARTVLAMALLVPPAAAIAVPLAMAFAAAVNYSDALPVVVVECGIVGIAVAGAVVLARRWALRPPTATTARPAHQPATQT